MTKTVYICDICGCQMDNPSKLATITVEHFGDRGAKDSYDLCKSCHDNVTTIINGLKKNK